MVDRVIIKFEDLKRVLREGSGVADGVDLDGEVLDLDFYSLGYDSLALLETAARISREYRIALDDDIITSARTPRELLDVINAA
jgi:act minimal PKS acyl carrier protein